MSLWRVTRRNITPSSRSRISPVPYMREWNPRSIELARIEGSVNIALGFTSEIVVPIIVHYATEKQKSDGLLICEKLHSVLCLPVTYK